MAQGSRYWANSYVVLSSGRKIYLASTIEQLEKKIKSKARIIKVEVSGLYGDKIQINKNAIEEYGKV